MSGFEARLTRHLREWLGAWPPAGPLQVVGSPNRVRPGWDGKIYPVAGVATPDGTVLSVPPALVDAVGAAGPGLDEVATALPALVGRPGARPGVRGPPPSFGQGAFRWCRHLVDAEAVGVWLPPDDPRVPDWLRPFHGDVLVFLDGDGRYGAGVGRKRHDAWGQELSVATEAHLRGRGLARALVARAARRVAEEGAVATYLHAFENTASARVAEAAGFPDAGWRVLGLPVAS